MPLPYIIGLQLGVRDVKKTNATGEVRSSKCKVRRKQCGCLRTLYILRPSSAVSVTPTGPASSSRAAKPIDMGEIWSPWTYSMDTLLIKSSAFDPPRN